MYKQYASEKLYVTSDYNHAKDKTLTVFFLCGPKLFSEQKTEKSSTFREQGHCINCFLATNELTA